MKKLLLLFVVFTMIFTSCGVYQMVSYPKEIKDKGGELTRSVTSTLYEVRVGEEITRKQDRTQTYLYLYKLDDDYYWKIRRSPIETQNSFFPQNLDIKVDAFKSGESKGSHGMYGIDELTGKRYNIIQIPWSKGYGYFYIFGDEDKQIIYSVSVTEITIH